MTPFTRFLIRVLRIGPQRPDELDCHIRRDIGLTCPADPRPLPTLDLRLRQGRDRAATRVSPACIGPREALPNLQIRWGALHGAERQSANPSNLIRAIPA